MIKDAATFYDIHRKPDENTALSYSLEQFLEAAAKGQLFASDEAAMLCPPLPDPTLALEPSKDDWLKLQAVLAWSLTGKLADKETLYPYREIYRAMLKKYGLESTFRLSAAFAYLLCGVRLKRHGWGSEDKNNIDDFSAFCEQLLDPAKPNVTIYTFMCAHREADEADKNKLVRQLKTQSFVRIANLLKGVACNVSDKRLGVVIHHLDGARFSLLAIFPNIIFRYAAEDGIQQLLDTLDGHYKQIDELAARLSDDTVTLQLTPTTGHIAATRRLCETIGGKDWRRLTPASARQAGLDDSVFEIAEESATDEVTRYMPEYGAIGQTDYSAQDNQDADLIAWYKDQEDLTPFAKALYETLFYYSWGKLAGEKQALAIGMDRDHSDFQVRAFHAGYHGSYEFGSRAPLVYLRRSEREIGKNDVHSISLRQFWRHSDDHKR
jgi:hypothetical protein